MLNTKVIPLILWMTETCAGPNTNDVPILTRVIVEVRRFLTMVRYNMSDFSFGLHPSSKL
jgi:hypothetical protein